MKGIDQGQAGGSPAAVGVSSQDGGGNVVPDDVGGRDPMQAFTDWSRRYLEAPVEERAALVAEGVALAEARRPVFQALIRDHPQAALRGAVPMVERQDLPREVTARLETRVNARGALRVYQGVGPDNLTPVPTHRVAELANGSTYQAYVYGRRAESVAWVADASVNGVAVDHDLAVNEEPFRPLETGERPDPEKTAVELCPVSGETSLREEDKGEPITEATPALEVYGEIVYLCDGSHTTVYRQTLIQAEGASGGAQTFTGLLPATLTPSIGNVRVLVIPMTFADQNTTPATESTLYNLMRAVGSHYAKASYGKLTLLSTVSPPVTLPHNEAWYVQQDTSNGGTLDGLGLEHSHARAEARKLGFDDDSYDCVVVRLKGGARPAGGWGGGRSVWIYGDGPDVTAHEVGHVFGLAHANFWDTAGTSAIGLGTNAEYGGHYDVMGGLGLPDGHYNVQAKNQIRWLPDSFAPWVTAGGLYRIHAQDQAMLDPGKRYALRVRKDNLRTYWGELRGLHTGSATETWADQGLILGWRYPGAGGNNIQLIDTTPGSAFGKSDAPISLGRTFSDPEAGIHITTLAVNPATATTSKSVDVQVNFGAFPDNIPPSLSLAVSTSVVPVGAPVTFTATASDEDGDALAFSWRHFGDPDYRAVSPNAPVITRSFAAAGTYVVACTVSDMKGGAAIRSRLVTVGDGGGRSVISGRVTDDGAGLAGVTVNANSANGVITDSDGYYTIPNLPAGAWTMTPLLHGWTFNPLFSNSIRTPPAMERVDFEAVAIPRVTLTAPVPAGEGNAEPGKFLLIRTGGLSQDLTVNFTGFSGTAGAGDYTVFPALAAAPQSLFSQTIPAGSDRLELAITPVDDAAAEGVETLTLQMAAGNGYLIDGLGAASMSIQDNDTTLPRVRLAVVTGSTLEGSAVPATVRVSRTGDTAAPLTVAYEVSGTAESDRDFRALPGVVEIPAGASGALISVESLDDTVPRGTRTVVLRLKLQAASVHDSATAAATVSIVDDDLQMVSVAATDAVATERDVSIPGTVPDTATFLITRTGSTEFPLTVYYAMAGVSSGGMATALHGVDYEALPGVLTIPAGQSSGAVTIVPCHDGIGEGPESVTIQLGAGHTSYQPGPDNSAAAVIMDAGDPPYVEVTGIDNASEGQPVVPGIFRFSLKGSVTGPVEVKYTVGGTAVSGVDFTPLSGAVTLPVEGLNAVDVRVTPLNDGIAEDLESIIVTLTPDPAYGLFTPTGSAMIQLRDAGRPTVFVDAADSGYPPSFSEDSNGSAFYLSRTGALGEALMVNYTLAGTATAGEDYTAMSGGALIPAGARGVLVPIRPVNDTLAEGTETVELTLADGAYSRSPAPAVFYITDNETPEVAAGFPAPGMAVMENAGIVEVPVTLSAPSSGPVTVEYLVDRGSHDTVSATGVSTGGSPALPYWIRCRKTGGTVTGLISKDGVNWTEVSSQTVSFATPGSVAGLAVCSWNPSMASTARFDNVSVEAGPGAAVGNDFAGGRLGSAALAGGHSVAGGVFTVSGGGDNLDGITDQGYFVSWPVSGSGDCTITARVVSLANTNAQASAAVMIRESGANNAARGFTSVTAAAGVEFHVRAATGLVDSKFSAPGRPFWLRLERDRDLISAFQAGEDGVWVPVGGTVSLPMGQSVTVGLALSSFVDGETASASFDQVGVTFGSSGIEGTEGWEGRNIGFSGAQGASVTADGIRRITASGDGFEGTEDSGFYVSRSMRMMTDFTLTTRILETRGPGSTMAGLMIRQADDRHSRMAFIGAAAGGAPRFIRRQTGANTALGAGVDYTLPAGLLTFPPGVTSASIPVRVWDDILPEPDESIIMVLRNARGARVGSAYQFALVIADDDQFDPKWSSGFCAPSSTADEGAGTVRIPVALSSVSMGEVTVGYTVEAGTAVAGRDFTPATGQLRFAPGQTVAEVPVTLLDNAMTEPDRTVVITLSRGVGAALNAQTVHTLTIADDDRAVVTLSSADPSASEAGDPATVKFSRTGPLTGPLTVNYTLSGTAVSGTDYTGLDGGVVIPAGAASQDAVLTPVRDGLSEGSETVVVTLAEGAGYTPDPAGPVTLTIADADRSTVTITAGAATLTEGGGAGIFTLTRGGGDVSAELTVGLTLTGTATAGVDFTTVPPNPAALVFEAGQTVITVTVTPVDDALTEGPEVILAQLTAGPYDTAGDDYASLTLVDNDTPPTVYIQSPGAQGVVVAPGNGLRLRAVLGDSGPSRPVSVVWSVVTGPGKVTFDPLTGSGAETAAVFSDPGTYLVRVTASDGRFSGSDQTAVTVTDSAPALPAGWISTDIGVPGTRGFSGMLGNGWRLHGAGTGYDSKADQAHAAGRTIEGDGVITARLTEVGGAAGAEAGLFIRDSWQRSARRAALVWTPSGRTLKFRARTVAGTVDTSVSVTGSGLPLWLRLARDRAAGTVTAFQASDHNGRPGAWAPVGAPVVIAMDAGADYGLTTDSGGDGGTLAEGAFDNVALTPEAAGPAVVSEDFGDGPQTGTYLHTPGNDEHVLTGQAGGLESGSMFRGQQFTGDFMITVLQLDASSGAANAYSGLMIRDTMDDGPMAFAGRNPFSAYPSFVWRANPRGGTAGVNGISQKTRWLRLIRQGNQITALHAPDNGGTPGGWMQLGQTRPVFMGPCVLAGLVVSNGEGTGLNTVKFTKLSVTPLNRAPVVGADGVPSGDTAPVTVTLKGRVQDDGQPSPVTTQWASLPGTAVFVDPAALETTARLEGPGTYRLRLWADDGLAASFGQVTVTAAGAATAFETWQEANFPGAGGAGSAAPLADPDQDGLVNLCEYALGTDPNTGGGAPLTIQSLPGGEDGPPRIRITLPRNPAATDAVLQVEASADPGAAPAVWGTGGLSVESETATEIRVLDTRAGSPRRFYRLRVTRAE